METKVKQVNVRILKPNAGCLLTGIPWEEATRQILHLVIHTASGDPTRNETNGYHEIAIWKDGVTL